jgi:hypothetical protein
MATNKERIEMLEAGLGGVQEGVQRIEMSMTGKMHQLEETINKLSEALLSSKALLSNKGESSHSNTNREGNSRSIHEENEGNRQVFSSKMAKLEFPRFSGQDPTEWFNVWTNSLNFKILQPTKKYHWLLSIWKEKQISGGSGLVGHIERKDE